MGDYLLSMLATVALSMRMKKRVTVKIRGDVVELHAADWTKGELDLAEKLMKEVFQ